MITPGGTRALSTSHVMTGRNAAETRGADIAVTR